MEHYQSQYGATPQSTDEYGNPTTTTVPLHTGGGPHQEKGMMDKIKEKLPGTGVHSDDPYSSHSHTPTTTTPYGGTTYTGLEKYQQEKGVMDKIKEKLPGTGGHTDDPYSSHSHTTPTTTPHGETTYTEEHHETKGIKDKIKEKLPGTGHH